MTLAAPPLRSLDHVALWVADRDRLAAFACGHLGMHVIDRTERFTLLGADARRGKLTLFAAEGPRERGALERVALRVPDLARALAALPAQLEARLGPPGEARFTTPEGLVLALVERPDADVPYDLDHVVLRCADPAAAAAAWERLGLERDGAELRVADKHLRLVGGGGACERPLLNHLAVLVESAAEAERRVRALGAEVAEVVDAANTLAVFVWGPDRVKLEYVEHKPTFSLV